MKYDWVFKLKKLFPHLNFVINGGFNSIEKVNNILKDDHPLRTHNGLEGCMSGRLAMDKPWQCARVDREVFGDLSANTQTREEILLNYAEFCQKDVERKIKMNKTPATFTILIKPVINLFAGERDAKKWK